MRIASTLALATAAALVAVSHAFASPSSSIRPAVAGAFKVGAKLTADKGTWAGSGTLSFGYQWYRCDAAGGRCKAIPGAATETYAPVAADAGKTLGLTVRATDASGSASAYSSLAGPIASGLVYPTAPPRITGSAEAGQELKVDGGSWPTSPQAFAYQWLRCNPNGRACSPIAGATSATYRADAADVGRALVAQVTARIGSTSQPVFSVATTAVAAQGEGLPAGATPLAGGRYSIPVDSVSLPARLVVAKVSLAQPATLTVTVADSRGYAVRGALVAVTAPYGWVAPVKEAPTAADGTVAFPLTPKSGRPRGVVLYVRARKLGDDVLAGVTGTRLVTVRIP